jgi:hypothetical protein
VSEICRLLHAKVHLLQIFVTRKAIARQILNKNLCRSAPILEFESMFTSQTDGLILSLLTFYHFV